MFNVYWVIYSQDFPSRALLSNLTQCTVKYLKVVKTKLWGYNLLEENITNQSLNKKLAPRFHTEKIGYQAACKHNSDFLQLLNYLLPQETEWAGFQMGRQCGHWHVGWVFLHYWQGCTIWHCSWLVGGLHPTLGDSTLIWVFHEGTKLRKRGRLPPQLLKSNIAWRWGMGMSFRPESKRYPHVNPAFTARSLHWGQSQVFTNSQVQTAFLPWCIKIM